MLKFEYHHLEKTLFTRLEGNPPQEIPQSFTTDWEAPGFILEPINHWITFTVWPNKIRVFYKQVQPHPTDLWSPEIITYHQKDLPKQEVISFTFTPQDEVHKINNQWVKKN